MSICGVGVDLLAIARMRQLYARHGERALKRILHPVEQYEIGSSADMAQSLAKRFAVKEATAKALGTGFTQGVRMHDIYLTHEPTGQPLLHLVGMARERAYHLGASSWHVSLSDERDHVLAFVIMESDS